MKIFASSIPFVIIGAIMIYVGYKSDPSALTDDGMNLKMFLYYFGASFAGFSLIVSTIIYGLGRSKQKRLKHLMEKGVQGRAKILALEDTGVYINNMPRLRITLEIKLPSFEVYQLTKKMTVPHSLLAKIQTGTEVDVMVDPSDHKNPDMVGLLLK